MLIRPVAPLQDSPGLAKLIWLPPHREGHSEGRARSLTRIFGDPAGSHDMGRLLQRARIACTSTPDMGGFQPKAYTLTDAIAAGRAQPLKGTTSPFILHLYAALSEKERNLIAGRTKAALAAKKAQGKVLGGPKLPEAREAAQVVIKTNADRYAANVLPIIREAQKAGASMRCITLKVPEENSVPYAIRKARTIVSLRDQRGPSRQAVCLGTINGRGGYVRVPGPRRQTSAC
jgi:hypothetical protein